MAIVAPAQRNFPLKIKWRRDKLYKHLLCLALKIEHKFMEKTCKTLNVRKNKNSEVFCADRQLKNESRHRTRGVGGRKGYCGLSCLHSPLKRGRGRGGPG